ncbi:hypothetical protein FBZ89_10280 [Nitrospirillum amazonense]|uniref:Uncharacterized protein n=1 Tax=Nitrospirillum amazonense TaxID=28077 RepID=A0A560FNX1_9PROT|nr:MULTISPECIES: hypothetical protein [Nitrospirillum]MEA1652492.1 hypothetical protein [Nitrospirillum sp. BR 11164]TWB23327.1 hypothetical protein FBZ89_10280 [Nitrospirillum amazonense]
MIRPTLAEIGWSMVSGLIMAALCAGADAFENVHDGALVRHAVEIFIVASAVDLGMALRRRSKRRS